MEKKSKKTASEILIEYGYVDFVNCDPPSDLQKAMQQFSDQENKALIEKVAALRKRIGELEGEKKGLIIEISKIGKD